METVLFLDYNSWSKAEYLSDHFLSFNGESKQYLLLSSSAKSQWKALVEVVHFQTDESTIMCKLCLCCSSLQPQQLMRQLLMFPFFPHQRLWSRRHRLQPRSDMVRNEVYHTHPHTPPHIFTHRACLICASYKKKNLTYYHLVISVSIMSTVQPGWFLTILVVCVSNKKILCL